MGRGLVASSFTIGEHYSREEVAEVIGLPANLREGGTWMTGYSEWQGSAYVFTNVGIAGRTGHDYANRWVGKELIWFGKTISRRGQPQIDRMISNTIPVHVFWRGKDRAPFTYAGNATAVEASGDKPVQVIWAFPNTAPGRVVAAAEQSEPKWRRGPPPTAGTSKLTKADGATDVYVMRLEGPVEAFLDIPEGHAVIKVGMSNNVQRRLDELNCGFPPGSAIKWRLVDKRTLADGNSAWEFEGVCLEGLRLRGEWIGGEFAVVCEALLKTLLR